VREEHNSSRSAEPLNIILIGAFNIRKPMAIGVPCRLLKYQHIEIQIFKSNHQKQMAYHYDSMIIIMIGQKVYCNIAVDFSQWQLRLVEIVNQVRLLPLKSRSPATARGHFNIQLILRCNGYSFSHIICSIPVSIHTVFKNDGFVFSFAEE